MSYSDEEVKARVAAAVDAAVAGLRTELDELRASREAAAIEERIATAVSAATEPLTAQVSGLQASLDEAKIEAANEKARADAAEADKIETARKSEIAARRDDRLAQVKAAAPGFDEAYLANNADRWAAMDDAEFATRIEEYEAASKAAPVGNGPLPRTTTMTAAVIDKGGATTGTRSALKDLSALQRQGFDPRRI